MARHFDNWLEAYMQHTSMSESPDQFHLWTGISTIAAALRRRVWIDELKFQWTPNMYIILVGPPGIAAKSTSMRDGSSLLERVKGPYLGPTVTTWQKLLELMKEAQETMKIEGKDGKKTEYIFSCVTFNISELGSFFRLNDDSFVSVLIDLFDAHWSTKPWSYATKTSGSVDVMNPWINFIGCTTPTWLQDNYTERMIGGGLTSRIIFIYGDRKRKLVAYPSRTAVVTDYRANETKLVEDLQRIATMGGQMRLDDEAAAWGEKWYFEHHSNRPADMASDRYNGYMARKQAHLHKLAMICSAAHHGSLTIEKRFLLMAEKLLLMAEAHMKHVFKTIGMVDEAKHGDLIVRIVQHFGSIKPEDLWIQCRSTMKRTDFDNALILSMQEGRLDRKQVGVELHIYAKELKPEEPKVAEQ